MLSRGGRLTGLGRGGMEIWTSGEFIAFLFGRSVEGKYCQGRLRVEAAGEKTCTCWVAALSVPAWRVALQAVYFAVDPSVTVGPARPLPVKRTGVGVSASGERLPWSAGSGSYGERARPCKHGCKDFQEQQKAHKTTFM